MEYSIESKPTTWFMIFSERCIASEKKVRHALHVFLNGRDRRKDKPFRDRLGHQWCLLNRGAGRGVFWTLLAATF